MDEKKEGAQSHSHRSYVSAVFLASATLVALKYRSKWCAHKTVLIICLDLNVAAYAQHSFHLNFSVVGVVIVWNASIANGGLTTL